MRFNPVIKLVPEFNFIRMNQALIFRARSQEKARKDLLLLE